MNRRVAAWSASSPVLIQGIGEMSSSGHPQPPICARADAGDYHVNDLHRAFLQCFPLEPVPVSLTGGHILDDDDIGPAETIVGTQWTDIDPDFWSRHYSIIFSLSPESFLYYLPSMLLSTLKIENEFSTSTLTHIFDTSGNTEIFSFNLVHLIENMNQSQCACLVGWSKKLTDVSVYDDEIQEIRVRNTARVIQQSVADRSTRMS